MTTTPEVRPGPFESVLMLPGQAHSAIASWSSVYAERTCKAMDANAIPIPAAMKTSGAAPASEHASRHTDAIQPSIAGLNIRARLLRSESNFSLDESTRSLIGALSTESS